MSAEENVVITRNATQEVRRLYNVKEVFLGKGAYGQVYLGELKRDSNIKYAVKILMMNKMSENLRNQMREELKVLYKIDHPYIVQYVQSFEDDKYLYCI